MGKDYITEYKKDLDWIFSYDIFEESETQEEIIVRLHFDYIKQHTVISFPTYVFLNNIEEPFTLKYSIVSKNYPDLKKGTMIVKPME